MGEERGEEVWVWGPEELRSHGKSEVYLLYWYKSTNTDAEELCLPGRFHMHFLELADSTRMEILVFLEGCFCVTFSSACDCMRLCLCLCLFLCLCQAKPSKAKQSQAKPSQAKQRVRTFVPFSIFSFFPDQLIWTIPLKGFNTIDLINESHLDLLKFYYSSS
jgi:hypothetical protein